MALSDNSKDRIKFACKELEEALTSFETEDRVQDNDHLSGTGPDVSQSTSKITEIKRQLRSIREQLDQLSN